MTEPSERSREQEIRDRAERAAKLSGWLYDDYDGGTNLEVLAGLMATKDIPYLLTHLAHLEAQVETAREALCEIVAWDESDEETTYVQAEQSGTAREALEALQDIEEGAGRDG